jgi:Cdc6-like AAA superfamily ATPase
VEGLDYFRSLRDVQLFVVQQAHLHSDERFVSNEGYMGGSYMSEEGAEEEGGEGKESVRDPSTYLTMHKRSPIKPVYKAGEAGVHIDRLVAAPSPVSPSPLSSPAGTGATVTPEHFNNPLGKAQVLTSEYPFELDMQHVIDALATSSPADDLTNGDTDFIPLTQAHVRAHASDVDEMESEEGEEEGEEFDVAVDDIISLLQSSNPNFNRIFALLSNMEESWSYFYISTGGHNLANLEGGVGRSTVWFRPNRGFSSLSMVKDEDYFYSEAALIDHLRVQYGLQSMPEHQSTSKKPRSTRSGRQLTVPDDVEEEEAQMEVEVDEASQEMVVSLDVQGRGDKKRKSRDAAAPAQAKKQKAAVADSLHNLPGASSTSMAQQPKEPAAASLRERLEEVRRSLKSTSIEHSKYSGRPESCDVGTAVGRSTEHTRILQVVVSALTNAEGVAMYLCGSPGVGKTMTVVNVLNEVAKYSRQSASDSIVSASLLNATVAGRGRRGRSGDMEVDFLERDSKQAAAEAGADLPYRVICLNGAHLREKQDAYALLAEQLRIPVDRETDLVQSVADYFLSEGQRVSLRLPGGSESGGDVQDGLSQGRSADSSPTQADFKSRTGRGARQKASTRPMSVLFIDEIDLANSEIVAHLLQLSSFSSNRTGSSSLVLLGLGNNITFLNSMRDRGAPSPEQVVFRHYDLSSLQEIVQANTADLFDSNSRKMLASKIMKAHKGTYCISALRPIPSCPRTIYCILYCVCSTILSVI